MIPQNLHLIRSSRENIRNENKDHAIPLVILYNVKEKDSLFSGVPSSHVVLLLAAGMERL